MKNNKAEDTVNKLRDILIESIDNDLKNIPKEQIGIMKYGDTDVKVFISTKYIDDETNLVVVQYKDNKLMGVSITPIKLILLND